MLAKGLNGFELSANMERVAEYHLRDLVCNNVLGHTGSDGSSPEDRAALFSVPFTELIELVLPEAETLEGIEILLENEEFLGILNNADFQFVGMAYSSEAYAGKNGVFVLIFFY